MENKKETPIGELITHLTKSANITGNDEYKSGLLYAIECLKTQKAKECEIIVTAVNEVSVKCVNMANSAIFKSTGVAGLFDLTGMEGIDYYSEKFK